MKVKDLIEALGQFPGDSDIGIVSSSEGGVDVDLNLVRFTGSNQGDSLACYLVTPTLLKDLSSRLTNRILSSNSIG